MVYRPKSWNDKTYERRQKRLLHNAEVRAMHLHAEAQARAAQFEEEFLLAVERHRQATKPKHTRVWRSVRDWVAY